MFVTAPKKMGHVQRTPIRLPPALACCVSLWKAPKMLILQEREKEQDQYL